MFLFPLPLECGRQMRQVPVSRYSAESLFGFEQCERQPTACLIGFGTKPCDTSEFSPGISERILDCVCAQQIYVKSVRNIEAMERNQIPARLMKAC